MTDLEREINTFTDQVVGRRVVAINGKITPTGWDVISERRDREIEAATKALISAQHGTDPSADK